MKNFVHDDEVVPRTAPSGGVVSGSAYLIGSQLVVSTVDAAEGDVFSGMVEGCFNLPKATGQAWTEGAKLYWDNGAHKVTTTSGGNTLIGCADAVAASGDTTGHVLLDGVVR